MIYRLIFKLVLQRIDAEKAHELASRTLRVVVAIPVVGLLLRKLLMPRDPRLQVQAFGTTFPSPLGVAAGVDKDASWFESLSGLGFGFIEVGTVTAHAQAGNERPRVFRLTRDRALLNRMGFPNPGATAVAERLRKRTGKAVVGVNVGKSRVVAIEDAGADYRASVRELAPFCDYLALNVSSPNTPGLRALQTVELLRPLIVEVLDELNRVEQRVPVLIKIGPDLSDDELDAICQLALEHELDGIVAVNTTLEQSCLTSSAERAASLGYGGISGGPLKARALEVLERLHAGVGDRVALVSVGGIETPDDAWQRICAGATLIQTYTGFVYGGPLWPARMNRGLRRRVRESGKASIQELIGTRRGPARPERHALTAAALDARNSPA